LVTGQFAFWLEGRTLDLDEGRLSGSGDSFVAFEEIGGADGGKDLVEVVSEYAAAVHADHSLALPLRR